MNYFSQESERLLFRRVEIADIPAWTEFFIDNKNLKYMGIDLSKDAVTNATEWIQRQLLRYEEEDNGHLAVVHKQSGELIGMGGILLRDIDGRKEYEIAYSLIPKYWGLGYGTEIAMRIKATGFQNQMSDRFVSIIDKRNAPSIKVAKKNGMKVLYETYYLGLDVQVYGIESA